MGCGPVIKKVRSGHLQVDQLPGGWSGGAVLANPTSSATHSEPSNPQTSAPRSAENGDKPSNISYAAYRCIEVALT